MSFPPLHSSLRSRFVPSPSILLIFFFFSIPAVSEIALFFAPGSRTGIVWRGERSRSRAGGPEELCAAAPASPRPAAREPLPLACFLPLQSRQRHERQPKMSGQTLTDRIAAAQYSVTGSAVARAVCKATTHEVMGPKKKHLDCKHPFCIRSEDPGLSLRPSGMRLWAFWLATVIQLVSGKGCEKSPGDDELLLHFFSYCIIPLFQPFFPS